MRYDLVFEGGGAKGIAFVGALQEFERHGHTHGRLLGTSAGAIVATFLAAGYSVRDMLAALIEKDADGTPVFTRFLGRPAPFSPQEVADSSLRRALDRIDIRYLPDSVESRFDRLVLRLMSQEQFSHLFSFIERGGWYSADGFMEWACRKLDDGAATGRAARISEMTLAELHRLNGKELSLVAADITDQRKLVLNHRTAPHCPVVWAVRMSMSLPLLWQEVIWERDWGAYLGRDLTGHRVVDGGLLSNFPIELFISDAPHVVELMGRRPNAAILGLLIDESATVPGTAPEATSADGANISELPVTSRILSLVETATQANDKSVIEAFEQFVCRLPAKGYRTTEFDMSDSRREALIGAGRAAMSAYFRSQELEGMKGPDLAALERARRQADKLATATLQ